MAMEARGEAPRKRELFVAGGVHDAGDVGDELLLDVDLLDLGAEAGEGLGAHDGVDLVGGLLAPAHVVAAHDGLLLGQGRVIDLHLKEETVELGLGQAVGAFVLDGVLGGEHDEGRWQLVGRRRRS